MRADHGATGGGSRARPEAGGGQDILLAAIDQLPVGVLIATPSGDRANAELRRLWRAAPDVAFDRRTVDRRLRPFQRRGPSVSVRRPASSPVSPIRSALAGRTTDGVRLFVDRLDATSGVVRASARTLVLADGSVGAVFTATDEYAAFETERLRDAFLGIVGHELRTPVSSILTAADLLALPDLDDAIRAEILQGLGEETRRLHALTEQLLRLADLERRGVDPSNEPVHLAHVARRVVHRRRRRDRAHGIRLDIPDGPVPAVAGEDGFVDQAIVALLDNAAKHAPGSEVTVRIDARGDVVEVHVLDRGPGLPKGGADQLFTLFQRSSTPGDGAPAGFGIGLFVARNVVEAMGGRIWAVDREGGGADVGFALPVIEEDAVGELRRG
ncbi:MAG TPA: HAMP domain-containing sensor histidine kinase [Candidatus Limnocylindrales bacterium]|nr:HAMP domain-containing sensor histidine kinase [Candidatus Limnocylindrales bacterium]